MKTKVKSLLLVSILLFSVNSVFAGTQGKIAGTVTDAETGKPLPAANVVIEGTTIGAATSEEGHYVILNVPSGMYNITVSMMGYARHTVTEVRVNIDQTTTTNFRRKFLIIR